MASRAVREGGSLLRPAVISEYLSPSASSAKSRLFILFTWAATAVGGLTMVLAVDYGGDRRNEHALSGVQRWTRAMYEAAVTGSWQAPPPPPPARPPPPALR